MCSTPATMPVAVGLLTFGTPTSSLVVPQRVTLLLLAPDGHKAVEK